MATNPNILNKQKEYAKLYREKNKDRLKEYYRVYNKLHKDKRRIYNKIYKKKNPEKINELNRRYYHKHKDKINNYARNYREKNRDKIKKYQAEYYLNYLQNQKIKFKESDILYKDFVICEICNNKLRRISNTHLKFHNITMLEYKKMFPNTPMESKVYLKSISNAGEKHPFYHKGHSIESRKKMSLSRMGPKNHRYGKNLPEWHKEILRKAREKRGKEQKGKSIEEIYGIEKAKNMRIKMNKHSCKYWQGKHLSEEHKRKLSKLKKGIRSPRKGKIWAEIYGVEKAKEIINKISGENHPNWLGGKSFEPYTLDFNSQFKETIRERDNYCCVICNKPQEELNYKLAIHHIDYDKKNTFPQNCVSLCRNHHTDTNFNRHHWKTFFQSLLKERYNYEYTQDQKIILDFTKEEIKCHTN